MEEEYLWRACEFMDWQPIAIRVPKLPPIPATGQQLNNPGYCYLVFRFSTQAAAALAQVSNGRETAPVMMPYSSSPFVLCWAPMFPHTMNPTDSKPDYSIFIADLPSQATEDDIIKVFRNPEYGQSPFREPKNIQPFKDCTKAKLIRDPQGNSCASAFVRYVHSHFTLITSTNIPHRFKSLEERNRALTEGQGLCVLERPSKSYRLYAMHTASLLAQYAFVLLPTRSHRHLIRVFCRVSLLRLSPLPPLAAPALVVPFQ